jgi:hypothetical protein
MTRHGVTVQSAIDGYVLQQAAGAHDTSLQLPGATAPKSWTVWSVPFPTVRVALHAVCLYARDGQRDALLLACDTCADFFFCRRHTITIGSTMQSAQCSAS